MGNSYSTFGCSNGGISCQKEEYVCRGGGGSSRPLAAVALRLSTEEHVIVKQIALLCLLYLFVDNKLLQIS